MSPSEPDPGPTMYRLLRQTARQYPQHIAHQFCGRKTTYQAFLHRIDAAARGLLSLGIQKGDKVTICMPNLPQALECFYALNRIGAVAVMIHPLSTATEIRFYLENSGSKAILTLDRFYQKVASILPELPFPCAILVAKLPFSHHLPKSGYISWRKLLQSGKKIHFLPPDLGKSTDCAAILYSGGTTGTPKGVLLSSENFNSLARQTLAASGFDSAVGMKMLSVMPIFHGFGLGIGIHTALVGGATCILIPKFTLKILENSILRHKPNILPGVPTLFEAMLRSRRLQKADLSFLAGIFCGGDALCPALQEKVDHFLLSHNCPRQIRQGYGATECVAAACLMPPHSSRPGSAGLPLPQMGFQIVLPGTQTPLAANQEGEICISGPTVMLGYLNAPSETADALQRHSDGRYWLHTGDLGFLDSEGFVHFRQRIKRIIVTSGYNVYPSQLESVLDSHPSVQYSCCIGVPDAYRGQKIRAYIVPAPGVSDIFALKQSLLAHCSRHIPPYARPREFILRPDLPRTAVGKIAYHILEKEISGEAHL